MTIGIASERPEYAKAQTRPTVTSRHCSRHSFASPFAVGQRLRSGGSTERERLPITPSYQRRLTRLTIITRT
jgi:hypothetical protein